MAKFLFVYRNNVEAMSEQPSPEDMQQAMCAWKEWFEKLGDVIIDGGDGLLPAGKQVRSGGTETDGPLIEASEFVSGFTVIQADTIEQAAQHAKGCPILARGGSVEVRQLAGYAEQIFENPS